MNRFEMAEALLKKAKIAKQEIGDDHGDPYEEALLTETVDIDLKINVKEVFDHLRSALDYCAHEICEVCNVGQDISSYKIYFPITKKDMSKENFRYVVGKNIPGLLKVRNDLLPILESFQAFYSIDNEWLSDFATLCNENKHQNLSVITCNDADMEFSKSSNGQSMITIRKKDGKPLMRSPLMIIDNYPASGIGKCTARYISIDETGEELTYFLDKYIWS